MTYVPPVWSDQYHGPRWRYGLVYRPLTADAFLPRDFILGSQGPATAAYPHGSVDYPYRLPDAVVKGHELVLVGCFSLEVLA
jgi:hypothetical protein